MDDHRLSGQPPTIADATARLRDGRTTAVELVERCLEAIAHRDGELNAFITVMADDARAAAAQADRDRAAGRPTGPLHGIPVSVKDLLDLRGLPTTAASRARAGHRAAADAPALAALRRAGAIFVGKCNLHEFAFGTTGADSAFGPTRNPHAPAHVAGGSSGGSAVSVAAGMALASVGTDTGGSIRIPAAACGVVGLKPTFGELACDGVVPLAPTLDHVGPLGLTVDDVAVVYRALAGDAARQRRRAAATTAACPRRSGSACPARTSATCSTRPCAPRSRRPSTACGSAVRSWPRSTSRTRRRSPGPTGTPSCARPTPPTPRRWPPGAATTRRPCASGSSWAGP